MPEDRSWVAFTLRPEARWHDGKPITVDDVIWTFETLKTKGAPFYRAYYANVKSRTADGRAPGQVHLRRGQQPRAAADPGPAAGAAQALLRRARLRPDHARAAARQRALPDQDRSSRGAPSPTSASRTTGAPISPVNRGPDNFDALRYDYYRDPNVALEAFKAGAYDLRLENASKFWATAYNGPPFDAGRSSRRRSRTSSAPDAGLRVQLAPADVPGPAGAPGAGLRVRLRVDQQHLFYGQYARTESYFSNSELASQGLPSAAELALLEPFRDQLPRGGVHAGLPAARDRRRGQQPRQSAHGAGAAGRGRLEVKGGNWSTRQGQPFRFEILLNGPTFERIALPFVKNLERLGIEATRAHRRRRAVPEPAWTTSTST